MQDCSFLEQGRVTQTSLQNLGDYNYNYNYCYSNFRDGLINVKEMLSGVNLLLGRKDTRNCGLSNPIAGVVLDDEGMDARYG